MKILMLSLASKHFFNWAEQLKDSGHEIYWLDVFDSKTNVEQISFINQIIGWRYRINFPGRYKLKFRYPGINKAINKFNERSLNKFLDKKIKEIEPDVVHSFVMYISTAPVLDVMKNHPEIKWVYSSWGSDLYYYGKQPAYLQDIRKTLPEIDFMFADCKRDHQIALKNGFQGDFLGVYPGGGGFELGKYKEHIKPTEDRTLIVIKGYQGLHGRCISILKALEKLKAELFNFQILIFGAAKEVSNYISTSDLKNWDNLKVLFHIPHYEVMKSLGEALLFIGNSMSDGTPNTLLEAIVMESFPIQSNPGGATAELIEHGNNGLLINDPEDPGEISQLILYAIANPQQIAAAIEHNNVNVKPELNREKIKKSVLEKYNYIEQNL